MTELRPMWSTTVHPSEYDIDEQMRDFVKAANKAKECYYGIDVGKLWGLYTAYKEQADEIATLRAQLAEAREALKPFAETSVDENYGGGGLWWTDYASGTRFSAYTGKIMSRRQLNREDIYKAAEVYNKLVTTA